MTIKAILDTNVLISGIFWKGAPFQILKAWQGRRFRLAISLPILDEYRRVLEEMTRKRPSAVLGSILALIELQSEMVEPVHFAKTVCRDPDDDKFLEAATGRARLTRSPGSAGHPGLAGAGSEGRAPSPSSESANHL